MPRVILFIFAIVWGLLGLAMVAYAAPIFSAVTADIENRPPDDIFGVTGLLLILDLKVTDTGGVSALTGPGSSVTAVSSNPGFPFSQPVTLNLNSSTPSTGTVEFTNGLPLTGSSQFPAVIGTYTYTVTNTSSESTNSTTHNLDKPEIIPFPTNFAFSNQSTTPVLTFTDPNPTPGIAGLIRQYQVFIFDDTPKLIFVTGLSTPNFTVPPGILEPGEQYFFQVRSLDIDTTEPSGTIRNRTENQAFGYASFQPTAVPEPSTLLLLFSGLIGLAGYGRKGILRGNSNN
jgi:hypothetical protein